MRISDWSSDVCSSDLFGAAMYSGACPSPALFLQADQGIAGMRHAGRGLAEGDDRLRNDRNRTCQDDFQRQSVVGDEKLTSSGSPGATMQGTAPHAALMGACAMIALPSAGCFPTAR